MNHQLFNWNQTAANVYLTVMLAVLTGGTPILGISPDNGGDIMFGIGY